jgi:hypothetical protein
MAERNSLALALALALASGALLAACYSPDAPLGAPCENAGDCPDGQSCDLETNTCGPPSGFTIWLDDTAESFTAPGADTGGVEIEPGGFVGPIGYFRRGIRISGIEEIAIDDAATTWNEVSMFARTGSSFVRAREIDIAAGVIPIGTGLKKDNGISLIVEGELLIEKAGDYIIELNTDERGFIDMAPPGSTQFARVATSSSGKMPGPYAVRVPGWHRFRGVIIDEGGNIFYGIKIAAQGQANPRDIDVDELRAPASDLRGSFVDGFEDPFMIEPKGVAVDAEALGGRTLASDPFRIPVGNNSYSLRFASQVLIDAAGTYVLRVESGQGHRVFIDGMLASDISQWDDNTKQQVSRPEVQLERGWHDLVVDLNRDGSPSDAVLNVVVETGPAWAGMPIPADHMRPVVPRSARWLSNVDTITTSFADGGSGTKSFSAFNVPIATVHRIDVQFTVSHSAALSQLSARLRLGNGGIQPVFGVGAVPGSGSHTRHVVAAPSSVGVNTFQVIVTDMTDAALVGGQITFAALTFQGTTGEAPFPDSYSYTSAPREIGNVESFAYVRWALRQERPETMATVSLRTCETAAACEDEPWTPVALGAVPAVTPRRFAQYRLEVAGATNVPTALDWIEIAYRSADKK